MSPHVTQPTSYPDANVLLQALLSDVQTVLGHHFVGLYVFGSLASGDFEPQRSDIDFVVVTADELPDELLPALEAMHARLTASGFKWATKLEGSYIPQRALRRYDPTRAQHPALRVDGSFHVDGHGSDWVIQRHVIREQGVVLAGPPPQTLIDPLQPNDLRRAALATLREWWAPQLQDHTRLRSREYQAYATLTMCRVLYTLEFGTVVSKSIATRWAQQVLGEPWAALIERALAWPRGAQPGQLDETLDFIRYALERSGQFELPADQAR
jgi:predicted nucleotidyltransferase